MRTGDMLSDEFRRRLDLPARLGDAMPHTQKDLDLAERHVFECEQRVIIQKRHLNRLLIEGSPTADADELLGRMQVMLDDARKRRDEIAKDIKRD